MVTEKLSQIDQHVIDLDDMYESLNLTQKGFIDTQLNNIEPMLRKVVFDAENFCDENIQKESLIDNAVDAIGQLDEAGIVAALKSQGWKLEDLTEAFSA